MDQQLVLLRENLALGTYPGYPQFTDRLLLQSGQNLEQIIVLDGSWSVNNHPNNRYQETNPDTKRQIQLADKNLTLDAKGRPLHPWLQTMITDPSIGVITGKGSYWYWGPNYTADNIVLCQDHVLLIKRKDTGTWALPGGYVNPGEEATVASLRELKEETGLELPEGADGTVTYQGPVVDPRITANAWPETTAVRYTLNQALPTVEGLDDAAAAAWFPLDVVQQGGILFGSHQFLLATALRI
jgi:ADP-ribose pyrophosphatase